MNVGTVERHGTGSQRRRPVQLALFVTLPSPGRRQVGNHTSGSWQVRREGHYVRNGGGGGGGTRFVSSGRGDQRARKQASKRASEGDCGDVQME